MKAYIFRASDNYTPELKQYLSNNLGPEDDGLWSATTLYQNSGTYFFINKTHTTEASTFYLVHSDIIERKLSIELMLEHFPLEVIRKQFA